MSRGAPTSGPFDGLGPRLRPVLLALGALALACLLLSLLPVLSAPWSTRLEGWGVGLLLVAPWTVVVGAAVAAVLRRRWGWAAAAALLVLLAGIAWLAA